MFFVVVVAAACWLLVKRTFREHMSPFVCLFILKMSLSCLFFVCLVMVYDVWQQYFFCFILLVGSIQIENCFGNCQKSRQKKVRSTTLVWFNLGWKIYLCLEYTTILLTEVTVIPILEIIVLKIILFQVFWKGVFM